MSNQLKMMRITASNNLYQPIRIIVSYLFHKNKIQLYYLFGQQLGGDSEDHPPPRPVMAAPAASSSGMGRRATMPNFLLTDQHDHDGGLPGTSGASGVHRASIALPPRAGDFPSNRSTLPPIGLRGSTSTTSINTPPNYKTLFTVGE